jgi:RimJ/RimL family protein N-acetyltransferase
MNVPVLETERLVLRRSRLEDYPAHAAIWSDPRTRQYFSDVPYSDEENWLRFQRSFGDWMLFGCGFWAIESRESGIYLGGIGFLHARRELDVSYRDMPETAWVLAPDFQGQGLAREAMRAVIHWGDENIDAPKTWCMINQGNVPSERLAARLGYLPADLVIYKGRPMRTFVRDRRTVY